jgi:uncharacterized protein DUF2190
MAATLDEVLALIPDNLIGAIGANDVRAAITELWHRTDGASPIEGLFFDTTPVAPTQAAGQVLWDTETNGLRMNVSPTGSLQIGYEMWLDARNTTGSTILDGTPVRIIAGGGNDAFIAPDNGQGGIVGMATQDILHNGNGRVTTFGVVHDLNTAAFADGALLFATAAGALTTTITSSFIGIVLNSSPTDGTVLVSPDSRTSAAGTTAARPTTVTLGFMYFDTTLASGAGKPVWWNGTSWRDATGAAA